MTNGDLEKSKGREIAAATVGGTVAGLISVAAQATNNPYLMAWALPVGAFAGAVADKIGPDGLKLVAAAWADPGARVGRFAQEVADAAGIQPDEIVDKVADDEAKRILLGRAVDAVLTAEDDWKIKAMAHAFIAGAEGGMVSEALVYIDELRELNSAHMRLLAVLYDAESANVSAQRIRELDTGLRAVAALAKRLVEHGLAEVRQGADPSGSGKRFDAWTTTSSGRELGEWLREIGAGLPLDTELDKTPA